LNNPVYLVGLGNLGKILSQRMADRGIELQGIVVRDPKKYEELYPNFPFISINKIPKSKEATFILCVKDDQIMGFLDELIQFGLSNSTVVHCSGSFNSRSMTPYFENNGYLYPLQTFNQNHDIDFDAIPIFVGGSNSNTLKTILTIANRLGNNVHEISESKRKTLHLCAVYINNFGNRLFGVAQDIANKEEIPFEYLKPLAEETVRVVFEKNHKSAQTGPAKRKDISTIERHLDYLKEKGLIEELEMYLMFTKMIQDENR
jgi:predicted short-subunit dehydrogenase-like oxidoreductase (DUF2520 family)